MDKCVCVNRRAEMTANGLGGFYIFLSSLILGVSVCFNVFQSARALAFQAFVSFLCFASPFLRAVSLQICDCFVVSFWLLVFFCPWRGNCCFVSG